MDHNAEAHHERHFLGSMEDGSNHQNFEADSPSNENGHPFHAFGRFLGDGIQSHVRRWKRDRTRKKLESHLVIRKQARLEVGAQQSRESLSRAQSLQSLGDIGMTLFSPLEGPFESVVTEDSPSDSAQFLGIPQDKVKTAREAEPDAATVDESDEDDDLFVFDDGSEVESPRLLTMDTMRQLRQAMPTSTQLKIWKRLYSLARDGDVFQTFLSSVAGNRQTLIVIQTSTGEMFGGFAEAHWGKLAMRTDGSYHGTGRSFLFSVDSVDRAFKNLASSPSTITLPDDSLTIHPWQGVNEYSILCSAREGGVLAMGGGGRDASFGFCVQDHFTKGSSGPCATFGNKEPLSSNPHFDVVDFEVYGFVHSW